MAYYRDKEIIETFSDMFSEEELTDERNASEDKLWEKFYPKVELLLSQALDTVEAEFGEVTESIENLDERITTGEKSHTEIIEDIDTRFDSLLEDISRMEEIAEELDEVSKKTETYKDSLKADLQESVKSSREVGTRALSLANGLRDSLTEMKKDIRKAHSRIDAVPVYNDAKIKEDIEALRRVLSRGKSGGNMNRNVLVGGNSSVLSRYTDINLIAGTGMAITYTNNDSKRTTDITIASSEGAGLNPQTPSGTINSSNVTFTCVGLVKVAFVDNVIDTGAVITGATNSTITYSVPPQNSVYAF